MVLTKTQEIILKVATSPRPGFTAPQLTDAFELVELVQKIRFYDNIHGVKDDISVLEQLDLLEVHRSGYAIATRQGWIHAEHVELPSATTDIPRLLSDYLMRGGKGLKGMTALGVLFVLNQSAAQGGVNFQELTHFLHAFRFSWGAVRLALRRLHSAKSILITRKPTEKRRYAWYTINAGAYPCQRRPCLALFRKLAEGAEERPLIDIDILPLFQKYFTEN